jgi:hypothetical protein
MYFYLITILIISILIIIYNNNIIDSFDNLVPDLYTYDTCCNEKQIKNCESYGKTGVCNIFKNNKSCMCLNSF